MYSIVNIFALHDDFSLQNLLFSSLLCDKNIVYTTYKFQSICLSIAYVPCKASGQQWLLVKLWWSGKLYMNFQQSRKPVPLTLEFFEGQPYSPIKGKATHFGNFLLSSQFL